jgi:HK97 family phage portal protein
MGFLSRIFQPSAAKAAEGEYRPGPYHLPITGGWLPANSPWNFWQTGCDPVSGTGKSAMVEACVGRYAQTIAMCPGSHWWTLENGGRERVTNSALNRILRRPNTYQSISDFLLNTTRALFLDGNAYALAQRNARFEVEALHIMNPRSSGVSAIGEDGSLFYTLGGNPVAERMGLDLRFVPQRDVLHIRLHTPRDTLKGESPLTSAAISEATSNMIVAQQLAFHANQSRPSYIMVSEAPLTKEQVADLETKWNDRASGMNQGRVPVTAHGFKPVPLSVSAQDMQLIEVLKYSEQQIALAFGMPLQILGIGGAPLGSTEALMNDWLASGLGFALNHIEEAMGNFFGLRGQPDEYLEFDTSSLLRSNFKDRIEAYARGVQGGIYAPNEARFDEGLPAAPFGDQPRVQQQVVPLDWHDKQPAPTPAVPPAPAPEQPDDEPEEDDDAGEAASWNARDLLAAADEYDRRAA